MGKDTVDSVSVDFPMNGRYTVIRGSDKKRITYDALRHRYLFQRKVGEWWEQIAEMSVEVWDSIPDPQRSDWLTKNGWGRW